MRVLFFGSSEYCLPVLESLNNNFELVAIITKKHQSIEKLAHKLNIPSFTPQDKKELSTLKNKITSLEPDISVVADYGLIIPAGIFNIPKHKTLNIHFSRLPDLRGASPVQYTILHGDKTAWITVQLLDVSLDTGDIIWQKPFDYAQGKEGKNETTDSLYKKLFNIASAELPDIISKYVHNELKPQKQDHSKATYSKILTREDGFIYAKLLFHVILRPDDESGRRIPSEILKKQGILRLAPQDDIREFNHLTIFVERAIRAFTPWPGVWTEIQITQSTNQPINTNKPIKKRLKILKAHIESDKLVPDLVQLEGKNPVTWKQFLEGHSKIIL